MPCTQPIYDEYKAEQAYIEITHLLKDKYNIFEFPQDDKRLADIRQSKLDELRNAVYHVFSWNGAENY